MLLSFGHLIVLCLCYVITSGSKPCDVLPPFLSRLQDGVDITQLDLLPFEMTGNDGFRNPVFSFTCDDGQKKTINGVKYDLPDQVWNIVNIPKGWLNSDIRIHKSSHSVKKSMANDVGLGLQSSWGIFSASSSYEKMQEYLTVYSKYIEEVTSFTSGYKVNIMLSLALNPGKFCQMYIDHFLPSSLNNTSLAAYTTFIKTFGTHYFNQGKFGGLFRLVLATDTSYYKRKTDTEIRNQASGLFYNILHVGSKSSYTAKTIDMEFKRTSSQSIRYFGGQTNLLDDGGISEWQPSVAKNPWLYGGTLTKVSEIIKDASKKQAMERAIEIYIDTAYLKELTRIVRWLYKGGEWNQHLDILKSYEHQLKELLSQPMPSHTQVVSIGKTIEGAVTVPDWFKEHTHFCMSWYSDGDKSQCNDGIGKSVCAPINSMTNFYKDDTEGKKEGGCLMSWGIRSSGYDDWFKNVTVCFKWWALADAGQCGGEKSKEVCASVETYTDDYKDDTDNRPGGCIMQWMLQVPWDAPIWMQRAELCFEWRSHIDGRQCGDNKQRKVCARANTYTSPYHDDSDYREGGCRLRWGINVPNIDQ